MCPVLEQHHELELERMRRSIAGYDLGQAQDLCWRLAQLAHHQDRIIRGATKRIAELECQEVLQVHNGSS